MNSFLQPIRGLVKSGTTRVSVFDFSNESIRYHSICFFFYQAFVYNSFVLFSWQLSCFGWKFSWLNGTVANWTQTPWQGKQLWTRWSEHRSVQMNMNQFVINYSWPSCQTIMLSFSGIIDNCSQAECLLVLIGHWSFQCHRLQEKQTHSAFNLSNVPIVTNNKSTVLFLILSKLAVHILLVEPPINKSCSSSHCFPYLKTVFRWRIFWLLNCVVYLIDRKQTHQKQFRMTLI